MGVAEVVIGVFIGGCIGIAVDWALQRFFT